MILKYELVPVPGANMPASKLCAMGVDKWDAELGYVALRADVKQSEGCFFAFVYFLMEIFPS